MIESHSSPVQVLKKTPGNLKQRLRSKRDDVLAKLMPALAQKDRIAIPLDEQKLAFGRQLSAWLAANKTILIFEPHSDDTALSMGAFFAQLSDAAKQQTQHVTVFTKGREIGHLEGFPSVEACYQKRKEEAETAYTSLGIPKNNITFLDKVDFIYRRFQHQSFAARAVRPIELLSVLLGRTEVFLPFISPRDSTLLRDIAEQMKSAITAFEHPVCFAPLAGYGRHIDHYIVRVALERAVQHLPPAKRAETAIIYYDDHPYNLYSPMKVPPGASIAQHPVNHQFKANLFAIFETQKTVIFADGMPPDLPPEQLIVPEHVARRISA
jgi:LmbE family N-acetylglucosaminyl deacetylase